MRCVSRNKSGVKRGQYYKNQTTPQEAALAEASKRSSQYRSSVYERMKQDGRLATFLKLVSTSATLGYNKNQTIDYVNQFMGNYFQGKNGLNAVTFNTLLQRYPDVLEAWTVNRATISGAATSRINKLIDSCGDIDQLIKIVKTFDNGALTNTESKACPLPEASMPTDDEKDETTRKTIETVVNSFNSLVSSGELSLSATEGRGDSVE